MIWVVQKDGSKAESLIFPRRGGWYLSCFVHLSEPPYEVFLNIGEVVKVYPKRKTQKEPLLCFDANDLDVCISEEAIERKLNEGVVNPRDAAIMRGELEGRYYEEEEE